MTVSWDSREGHRRNKDRYVEALGGFGYHASLSTGMHPLLRMFWQSGYFVLQSLWLTARKGRYDAVVAYAPFKTAWAGLLVKALTGAPLIVQMVVNPYNSLEHHRAPLSRFKNWLARRTLSPLLHFTDHLHLLYEEQKELLRTETQPTSSAFPDFAATSLVPRVDRQDGYILFLGFPWMLKGVDVLISAFNQISTRYPQTKLKIVGHCPDRSPFEQLAAGNEQIEFHKAVPHEEAMDLMSRCDFLVLPSRTEAVPRVIFEAWAAGKAVIASDVGGIPYFVRHGEDGLLFPSGDAATLGAHMAYLLDDPREGRRLGQNGYERVQQQFNERTFAASFHRMVAQELRTAAEGTPRPHVQIR